MIAARQFAALARREASRPLARALATDTSGGVKLYTPKVPERRTGEAGPGGRASVAGVKVAIFGAGGFLGRYVCCELGEISPWGWRLSTIGHLEYSFSEKCRAFMVLEMAPMIDGLTPCTIHARDFLECRYPSPLAVDVILGSDVER
mmetsp:Transcript_29806/g.88478  ORF Transcript_29806/g.88478 Transcript_29806/m.88478 type:complete len:147 (-) Transcript_29806:1281-1721(-)